MAAKEVPNNAPQRENIKAAIQYHMAFFEQEKLCLSEVVWFQGGRRVDAPYQHGDQRPAWNEVRDYPISSFIAYNLAIQITRACSCR